MLKKFIYGLATIALLCSCSEDFKKWTTPQSNQQDAASELINVAVTPVADIDIAKVEGDSVQLLNVTTSIPEGYIVNELNVNIIDANDSENPLAVSKDGKVAVADLQQVTNDIYGRRPTLRALNGKAVLYAFTDNTEKTALHSYPAEFTVNVTPEAPIIESAYYYIGAANGWSTTDQTYKLSNGGQDPYENPVFSVTIPATGGDNWFKIAPASAYELPDFWSCTSIIGAIENGQSDLTGAFKVGADGAFKIEEVVNPAKKYKLSFDMLEGTYTIELINSPEKLYYAGDAYGWPSDQCLMAKNGDVYTGYYYVNTPDYGSFKFVADGSWIGGHDGKIDGDDNISPADGEGYYQIIADWDKMTYTLNKINSITVVGNFNGWNQADANTHMTYVADGKYWEANLNLTDNGVKFAMNDDWSISWGGSNGDASAYSNLTEYGGKDLDLPAGAGNYNIKLYLSYDNNHKVVFTKQ